MTAHFDPPEDQNVEQRNFELTHSMTDLYVELATHPRDCNCHACDGHDPADDYADPEPVEDAPCLGLAPRRAYFINPCVRAPDRGYIPCIAQEGETGFWRTDWNWGSDLEIAEEIARQKNAVLGITPDLADRIVNDSMRDV